MTSHYALILAAGFSKRFGEDKRLYGSPSLIHQTLFSLLDAYDAVYIVHRYGQDTLQGVFSSEKIQYVGAPKFPIGLGESLAAGVLATPESCQSISVCLGDMPFIMTKTYRELLSHVDSRSIVRPEFEHRSGHPVIFGSSWKPLLEQCVGDKGASFLLKEHHRYIKKIAVDDRGIITDIDTKHQWQKLFSTNF